MFGGKEIRLQTGGKESQGSQGPLEGNLPGKACRRKTINRNRRTLEGTHTRKTENTPGKHPRGKPRPLRSFGGKRTE